MAAAASPAAAHDWGNNGAYNGYYGAGGYNNYNGYNGYNGYYGNGNYGYDRERWEHRDHDNAAPYVAAGLLGLIAVAAIASSHSHAQADVRTYDDHPDVCTAQRKVWDSYEGRYVTQTSRVAC